MLNFKHVIRPIEGQQDYSHSYHYKLLTCLKVLVTQDLHTYIFVPFVLFTCELNAT